MKLFIQIIFTIMCFASVPFFQGEPRSFPLLHSAKETFLTTPKILSEKELKNVLHEQQFDMTWGLGDLGVFRFLVNAKGVYFELFFYDELPDCFNKYDKNYFKHGTRIENGEEKELYYYCYRLTNQDIEISGQMEQTETIYAHEESYLAEKPRVFFEANPMRFGYNDLIDIVRSQNVIFYTGAGISAASSVPMMDQLMELLQLSDRETALLSVKTILRNPKKTAQGIRSFYEYCLLSPPTEAHKSLTEIAYLKKSQVLTENLDLLHERAGIVPYRISGNCIKTTIDGSDLHYVDYVICVGLSYDDKGFLGWYKKHHPEGHIISIDFVQPSYLGDDDYFIQGDLQKVLPELRRDLMSQSMVDHN